jgi:hypothetical protein
MRLLGQQVADHSVFFGKCFYNLEGMKSGASAYARMVDCCVESVQGNWLEKRLGVDTGGSRPELHSFNVSLDSLLGTALTACSSIYVLLYVMLDWSTLLSHSSPDASSSSPSLSL